jgi:hypothetical protein
LDTTREVHEKPAETKPSLDAPGPTGIAAIQGKVEATPAEGTAPIAEPKYSLAASRFQPETSAALKQQSLDDADSVLNDASGGKAEATAQTVLKHEGLPSATADSQKLEDVIPGHYDHMHGIDLVGISEDGKPIPIEVKKRAGIGDSLGGDSIPEDKMEPETLALKDDILRERSVNPALREEAAQMADRARPEPELANEQMAGLWTRDRWLKLVKDDVHRERLAQAGVSQEYLDLDNLGSAYSPQWRDILDNRTTVIVSDNRQGASTTLMREALFKRGFNVVGINLKA